MNRESIERGLHRYLARHPEFPGESYEFDIRPGVLRVPPEVRGSLSEEAISAVVDQEMRARLTNFAEGLKVEFLWIRRWTQAGRSGGWLALETFTPVLDAHGEVVVDLWDARGRLLDLNVIKDRVTSGLQELGDDIASTAFWRRHFPRLFGRKRWDPRAL